MSKRRRRKVEGPRIIECRLIEMVCGDMIDVNDLEDDSGRITVGVNFKLTTQDTDDESLARLVVAELRRRANVLEAAY